MVQVTKEKVWWDSQGACLVISRLWPGTSKMGQWVEVLADKPNDPSSIPGIHQVERTNSRKFCLSVYAWWTDLNKHKRRPSGNDWWHTPFLWGQVICSTRCPWTRLFFSLKDLYFFLSRAMVAHAFNPSILEAEVGRSLSSRQNDLQRRFRTAKDTQRNTVLKNKTKKEKTIEK